MTSARSAGTTKNAQAGVVVLLYRDRLVLVKSGVRRTQAARLIRNSSKFHRSLKFFPVAGPEAASTIKKINQSGIIPMLMSRVDADNTTWMEKNLKQSITTLLTQNAGGTPTSSAFSQMG